LGGPLLFGLVGGIGAAWLATEAGLYQRLPDGLYLVGIFYVVGLGVALGGYYQRALRRGVRPAGPLLAASACPRCGQPLAPSWVRGSVPCGRCGAPPEPRSPVTGAPGAAPASPPAHSVDAAWRAARLANLREERRQATLGWEPIGMSLRSPLGQAWSLAVATFVLAALGTLPVALGSWRTVPDAAGAAALAGAFWLLWLGSVAWIVRATGQRSRVCRQRAEVDALAPRIGWQVGQGLPCLLRWLDGFWEAPVAPRLLRPAAHHWCMLGTFRGYPLLFDLSPVGARHAQPRFIAALAAYPPSGAPAAAWARFGPQPPTAQLAWLGSLGLQVEHSEAGLFAIGGTDFVRDFERDPGAVARLVDIARVMVEHAEAHGAAPRTELP
jgi:hypothetical protein